MITVFMFGKADTMEWITAD